MLMLHNAISNIQTEFYNSFDNQQKKITMPLDAMTDAMTEAVIVGSMVLRNGPRDYLHHDAARKICIERPIITYCTNLSCKHEGFDLRTV
jgi:hypothetical protein